MTGIIVIYIILGCIFDLLIRLKCWKDRYEITWHIFLVLLWPLVIFGYICNIEV